jgi:hypothetical protein
MARFGQEILKTLKRVTADLAATLGPGTSTIQIRVGVRCLSKQILQVTY